MPVPYLIKISSQCGIPLSVCERLWEEAKKEITQKSAKNQNVDWAMVTNLFKNKVRKWLITNGLKICKELENN